MKKYRRFTEEFKRSLVPQIDSGAISKAAASRENEISPSLIDRWCQQIHEGTMHSPDLRPGNGRWNGSWTVTRRRLGN